MEPGDHACCDIDCKGWPGTSNGLTVITINDNHVDQGVIYLDHLQGALRLQRGDAQWAHLLARSLSTFAPADEDARVHSFCASSDGAIVWDC